MCNWCIRKRKININSQTLYNALNISLNNNKSRKIPKPFKGLRGIELIDKIIDIDQSPMVELKINPATYARAFGPIRDWFTNLPSLKVEVINLGDFHLMLKVEDARLAKVMVLLHTKCISCLMFI